MGKSITSYKELIVWQKAPDLVVETYCVTDLFPKEERFGLVSQMRRAAVSMPADIAEGSRRGSRKDFRHFLLHSYESGSEPETFVEIARRLSFGNKEDFITLENLLSEVMKMLNTMTHSLADKE